jgi:hypothetical protein
MAAAPSCTWVDCPAVWGWTMILWQGTQPSPKFSVPDRCRNLERDFPMSRSRQVAAAAVMSHRSAFGACCLPCSPLPTTPSCR